jgi:hypothetical protein
MKGSLEDRKRVFGERSTAGDRRGCGAPNRFSKEIPTGPSSDRFPGPKISRAEEMGGGASGHRWLPLLSNHS